MVGRIVFCSNFFQVIMQIQFFTLLTTSKKIIFYFQLTLVYKVSRELVESILSNLCRSKASNAAKTLVVTVPKPQFA